MQIWSKTSSFFVQRLVQRLLRICKILWWCLFYVFRLEIADVVRNLVQKMPVEAENYST